MRKVMAGLIVALGVLALAAPSQAGAALIGVQVPSQPQVLPVQYYYHHPYWHHHYWHRRYWHHYHHGVRIGPVVIH